MAAVGCHFLNILEKSREKKATKGKIFPFSGKNFPFSGFFFLWFLARILKKLDKTSTILAGPQGPAIMNLELFKNNHF